MRRERFTDRNKENPFVKSAEFIVRESFTDLGREAGISDDRIEGILDTPRSKGDPLSHEERPSLVVAAKRAIDLDTM